MLHSSLSYPLPTPEPGNLLEVAPGVRWLRLPLPYRLNHINVWALDDGEGWALVDTGARTEETVAVWERFLGTGPLQRPLTRVFITHMHPDHIGMAGWLTRRYDARMWISRLEYLSCRALVSDTCREAPAEALQFYREAGWDEAALEHYRVRFGNFGKHVHALPDSFRHLVDGQVIRIGRHDWEVVIGRGHSPEHACLYCPDLRLLISGDQVLPRISSNVSVYPTEPDADPMSDWMASLDTLQSRIPDDVLVLPSHNDCFHGLHARIAQLRQDQNAALSRLRDALEQPRRVPDTFAALFNKPVDGSDAMRLQLATGEAIACLNHLTYRGEIRKEIRDGVAWYQRTPSQRLQW
ncbi:MBL fold metallo-hydrolase [Azohydromonas caseinilytica]|uniref:MBL fold metallo-hydrolase n=1 Tax=Azohydromonas caseinilytica TaxID=2728836 RepID=A0A848FK40_9BURK|nr:MBL fold metallo-hydrolase [Azohydromonas caseinilytica]NML18161.1 MBL fold metallo-hydrolase [Azohydromonas caseinilytica]